MADAAEPELGRRQREHQQRTRWLRRVIPPAVILITAIGIIVYFNWREDVQSQQVRQAVRDLCVEAAAMTPGGPLPPAARRLQASVAVTERLHGLLEDQPPQLPDLTIDVQAGDAQRPYGDGTATHRAFIIIHGRTRLALRLLHPNDERHIQLIGHWEP